MFGWKHELELVHSESGGSKYPGNWNVYRKVEQRVIDPANHGLRVGTRRTMPRKKGVMKLRVRVKKLHKYAVPESVYIVRSNSNPEILKYPTDLRFPSLQEAIRTARKIAVGL